LRHKGHVVIRTPPINGLEDLKVGVLMDKEALCWNYTLLEQIFKVEDSEAILRTPLLNVDQQYTKICGYTSKGVHLVNSEYNVMSFVIITSHNKNIL